MEKSVTDEKPKLTLKEAEAALFELEQHRINFHNTRNKALVALRENTEPDKDDTPEEAAHKVSMIEKQKRLAVAHVEADKAHKAAQAAEYKDADGNPISYDKAIDLAAQAVLDARESSNAQ